MPVQGGRLFCHLCGDNQFPKWLCIEYFFLSPMTGSAFSVTHGFSLCLGWFQAASSVPSRSRVWSTAAALYTASFISGSCPSPVTVVSEHILSDVSHWATGLPGFLMSWSDFGSAEGHRGQVVFWADGFQLEASSCSTVWVQTWSFSMWAIVWKSLESTSPSQSWSFDIPQKFRGQVCQISWNTPWNFDWGCIEFIINWGVEIIMILNSVCI